MAGKRIVLDVLKGETVFPPPLWMMRQAGRYLPEYKATRAQAASSTCATAPSMRWR